MDTYSAANALERSWGDPDGARDRRDRATERVMQVSTRTGIGNGA